MINITTGKREAWAQLVRQWVVWESSLAGSVLPILRRQWRDTIRDVSQGIYSVGPTVTNQRAALREVLLTHYRRLSEHFHRQTQDAIQATQERGLAQKDADGIYDMEMEPWMRAHSQTQTDRINKTTISILAGLVALRVQENASAAEIAAELTAVEEMSNRARAATIARTETHTAYAKSVHESVRASGVPMEEKEWLSALDERTRMEHIVANGERVPMNEPFMATGEPLDYPGDPGGSLWNIINCRCVALYHTRRGV